MLCLLVAGTGSAWAQTVTKTVALPSNAIPKAVAVNPVTNKTYIANQNDNSITVIDGATNATTTVATGWLQPVAIAVNQETNKVYVANQGSNRVTIFDGLTLSSTSVVVGTQPSALAVNTVTNKIYVANRGGATVSVIDGTTDLVSTLSIAVGNLPSAVAVNPVTNTIYVANASSNTVSIIDGATDSVTTPAVATGGTPVAVAVNPVTNRIYVANQTGNSVTAIYGTVFGATIPVGLAPLAIAVNPVTNKIYVPNSGSGTVTIIKGADNSTFVPVSAGLGAAPISVVVNPTNDTIYVPSVGNNTVTVIDGASNGSLIPALPVGASPSAAAVNPVTNKIYVASQTANNVTVIDGATNGTTTAGTGSMPTAVVWNPVTNKIYVANQNGGSVTVLNGTTLGLVTTVATGSMPTAVAMNPITNRIYVVNQGSHTMSVIEGVTDTVIDTVLVGFFPVDVAVNPVTNKVYVASLFSGWVRIIDGATDVPVGLVLAPAPSSVGVNPVTNRIYAANYSADSVTVIDGDTNLLITTVLVGDGPSAIAVNPATNKIYVPNAMGNTLTVIDGVTNVTTTVATHMTPMAAAVNPVTNRIYVANFSSNTVTIVDGGTNSTTFVAAGTAPRAVAVNPVTDKIYVANDQSTNVTIIDGATATTVTKGAGNEPFAATVNPFANKTVVLNKSGDNATAITEQIVQPVPLQTTITPLPGNATVSTTPTFTFTAASTFAPTPTTVRRVYYQLDTWRNAWLAAAVVTPGSTFNATVAPLSFGVHILYAYATDGQDATSIQGSAQFSSSSSPLIGKITAYLFLVTDGFPTSTTVTANVNPAVYGDSVTLTATVATVPSGAGTPVGTVEFFDGVTSLGSVPLDGSGQGAVVTSTLTVGTHSITAVYTAAVGFHNSTSAPYSLVINKATPVITWPNPATMIHGTPLGGGQLNATTPVAGTMVYTPPASTVLPIGLGQPLRVDFTPTDTINYNTAFKIVTVDVINAPPTASGVTITGVANVGQTLTGNYTYFDFEGDANVSTFRWLRNAVPIGGATSSTYVIVAADTGQFITFEVTPRASTGTTPGSPVTSAPLLINSPPTASAVSITGTLNVGQTLTGNYTYGDVNGDPQGTSTFRWLRNAVPIGGATSSTYVVVSADAGQLITFEVTPVALTGTSPGLPVTSAPVTINSLPTASAVSISGIPNVGQTLTGSYTYADVNGDLEGTSTFRWLRNGVPIGGATSSTYLLVPADGGQQIRFEVTPVALTGSSPGLAVQSAPTTVNAYPTASAVSISGILNVGQTLTGNYTYADVDGDLQGVSTFRWLRNAVPIGGATSVSYVTVAADQGQLITFEVTPVALTGASPGLPVTSAGVTINSAPVASAVSISGTPNVGLTLTGVYTYSDVDGDLQGASTFRWLRNGVPIGGATSLTYIVVAADEAQSLRFEVTPVALTGTSPGVAVQSGPVTGNSFPTATSVAISGTAIVGQTLTGSYAYADVDGDLQGTSTFRWLRNGVPIGGATSSSYLLVAADGGQPIRFEVTPVAVTGSSPGVAVQSAPTTINAAPTATAVSISGLPNVGQTLTGLYTYADADGDLEGTSTFQWLRNGVPIGGATTITYVVVVADQGQPLRFQVTPVALTGTTPGATVQSAPVTGNSAPSATSVSISGTPNVGQTLTGLYTFTDVDGDAQGVSTYRWLRNGVPIGGATSQTYLVVVADQGQQLRFEVTPVAATGTSPGTAVQSAPVTGNSAPLAITVSASGIAQVGQTLTGSYTYFDVDGDLQGVSTFRWLRDGSPINFATSLTYVLVAADGGHIVEFEVTPVAVTGSSPGTPSTSPGRAINALPVASAVTLSGTAVVGQTLTGSYAYSDLEGDAEGVSTFRWLRNGVPIGGATSLTYLLVTADGGQLIQFEVTPVALTGSSPGLAALSLATTVNAAPVASAVSISGTPNVGLTLTGVYTYSDVNGDLQGASTFRWLRNGVPIGGATSLTYVVVSADQGQPLRFEVTPVALTGTSPGVAVQSGPVTVNSAPTASAVSISGTLNVGQTLTGVYTYADVDGDLQGTSTFRWLRNGVPIGGATSLTYVVVSADQAQALRFEVTPVAATGTSPGTAVQSGPVTINSAPVALAVSTTGTPLIGQTLTGSYIYADVDGDLQGVSTFRWLRNGLPIGGATSISYVLAPADGGKVVEFEVTPVALTGSTPGLPATSAGQFINDLPKATAVSISGTPWVGLTLTGSYVYSDADGDLEGVSTFRWLRNGVPIGGATSTTYLLVAADGGQQIRFEVTPVALTGSSPGLAVQSAATQINAAPVASAVSISGTPNVGLTLTGVYTYSDVDGDLQGVSTYRWLRNGVPIGGATSLTYVVVAADQAQALRFEVTPVAATGTSPGVAVQSGPVTGNSAPVASAVSISGTPNVGQTLTGNYTYSDVDSDLQGVSTYRWLRNGTPIGGATSQTYLVVLADLGQAITFEVTPVAATGTSPGLAVTSTLVTILNAVPTASAVSISGTPQVAQVLTGNYTYADVDGDAQGVSTFRWLRNGTPIGGATSLTYTVVLADLGQLITFEVTPVAATGNSPGVAVTSAAVTIVNSVPTASAVSIIGAPNVGQTLSGNYLYNDVDGDAQGTSTYRWLRNGVPIGGATNITYVVVLADLGQAITFEVTPVAATGASPGVAVTSTLVTILNSAPTASAVSISGIPSVGQTLSGSYLYDDVDLDAQGVSTFRWLRNGVPIGGATSLTYVVVAADQGQLLRFEVTPVALTGASPGIAVQSASVLINSAPTATAVSISGAPNVGLTLTGLYTYVDADGDLQGVSTFRWLRNGVPIGGATSLTYVVDSADQGQSLRFEVTPVALTGTSPGVAVQSAAVIGNTAPVATAVSISGLPNVGQTLTGLYSYSDVDLDLQGTSTFRWLRNGVPIGGATSITYVVVSADQGQSLQFEVTPVAVTGTSPGTAVLSAAVIGNSAPTATSVSISGTPNVGLTLTGLYSYFDADSDLQGTSIFRWLRNGVPIGGATSLTYVVVSADQGQLLQFEVTPVALTGTSPGLPVVSAAVTGNSAPIASAVSISGTPNVGQTLTGLYSYNDVDLDLQGVSTFRWLRNGSPIGGATSLTYVVIAADQGQLLQFEVTPVALTGTSPGLPVLSAAVTGNSAPVASAVSITGTPNVGQTLTGNYTYFDADGDVQGVSTFRWLRNGVPIGGATSLTYVVVAADQGQPLRFEVTPVAAAGTSPGLPVLSGAVTVNSAPIALGTAISGTPNIGQTLTGSYSYFDVDGDLQGTSTFRWLRNTVPIGGATSTTYVLVAADSGQVIEFEVTPVAATGTTPGLPATSAGLLINAVPTASAVSISGTAVVGQTLTGSYTYFDANGDLQGTSTFRWLRNGSPIGGATSITYVLVAADGGQQITFEVTPVALTGSSPGLPAQSAATTINAAPTATAVSITGNLNVGQTLTGNYTYGDANGDLQGTSTFRWLRNGVPIGGATSLTYITTALDAGQLIAFEVTPVALTGTSPGLPVTSAAVTINSAPVASAVSITGILNVGQTLTGVYTYFDADGDAQGISTFRWLRNAVPIGAATSLTYITTALDAGQLITFEVTPVALTGTTPGLPVTSPAVTINSAPVASAVSISGVLNVGQTLTGNYTYADVNGDLQGASTFRWLRNAIAIGAATSSTYVATAADAGQLITFEVTPVALTGTSPGLPVTSPAVTINSAPVASAVSISGIPTVGQTLTGNYSYADVNGDLQGVSTFRWLRNAVPIGGATSSTYVVTAADVSFSITFEVTPVALTGTSPGLPVTSAGVTILNSAPTATGVSITGLLNIGATLTGNYAYADVDGDLQGVSTFRWLRNAIAIGGATSTNYVTTALDAGQLITFEVTPVAATGTSPGLPVTSPAVTINSAPTATAVSITGTPNVGQTLTGIYTYFDADGDLQGTSTFRWLRNAIAIGGATTTTYVVLPGDAGALITFEVTPVALTGTSPGVPVTSPAVTINSAPTASAVAITGLPWVGQTLTGVYTYADVNSDFEGVSTFRWLRNGVPIGGATSLTYVVVALDQGQALRFEVTPVALTGTSPGTAVQSAPVTGNTAPVATAVSISGVPNVGQTLTGIYTYNDVDPDPQGVSTFRWLRNGVPIGGATSLTYVVVAADQAQALRFEVTPVASTGTSPGAPVQSAPMTINSAPTASLVAITGSPWVGQTLTGLYTYADVDGNTQGISTFRWLRNGLPISGATSLTYLVVSADAGQLLTFEVTPVATAGTSPGLAVQSAPVPATTPPFGTLSISKVLTGGPGGFLGPFLISFSCTGVSGPSGTISLNAGSTFPAIVVPLLSTCTVTEPAPPAPPSGYTWGPTTILPSSVTIPAEGGPFSVTVTNTLVPVATTTGTLKIKKVVSGAPSGFTGTFGVHVVCSSGGGTYDRTISYPSSGYVTISGIPTGVTCTVTETSQSAAASGYVWTGTTISPTPSSAIPNGSTTIVTVTNTMTKLSAPKFTCTTSTTFYVGSAGSFTVTVGGFPTPTVSIYSITKGGVPASLPSGVTFDPVTRKLSGTPASGTRGTYVITFKATNGVAPDATLTFTLTVR